MKGKLLAPLIFFSGSALADGCNFQRSLWGNEAVTTAISDSSWQADRKSFASNSAARSYISLSGQCAAGENGSGQASLGGFFYSQRKRPGDSEGKKRGAAYIINELYGSWNISRFLFIDIGKKKRANGFLFTSSPLDIFRTVRGYPQGSQGDSVEQIYSEGAWSLSSSFFNKYGTLDITIIPRLVKNRQRYKSAAEWRSLERTNAEENYYVTLNMPFSDSVDIATTLQAGDKRKLAAGISGNLSDKVIVSAEGGLLLRESWRHIHSRRARESQQYKAVSEPFQQSSGAEGEFGVSLRYNLLQEKELGFEYYAQSQGYSRKEWNNLQKTIYFVNKGYRASFEHVPGYLSNIYQQYASFIAAESDNVARSGYLQGKHYATFYIKHSANAAKKIDWKLTNTTNLADRSGIVNLNLTLPWNNQAEAYAGFGVTYGQRSDEFPLFGNRRTSYAGLRFYW